MSPKDWQASVRRRLNEQDYGHGNEDGDALMVLATGHKVSQVVDVQEGGRHELTFELLQYRDRVGDKVEVRVDGRTVETVTVNQDQDVKLTLGDTDYTGLFQNVVKLSPDVIVGMLSSK